MLIERAKIQTKPFREAFEKQGFEVQMGLTSRQYVKVTLRRNGEVWRGFLSHEELRKPDFELYVKRMIRLAMSAIENGGSDLWRKK